MITESTIASAITSQYLLWQSSTEVSINYTTPKGIIYGQDGLILNFMRCKIANIFKRYMCRDRSLS